MSITFEEETKKNTVSCNWTGLEDLGSLTAFERKTKPDLPSVYQLVNNLWSIRSPLPCSHQHQATTARSAQDALVTKFSSQQQGSATRRSACRSSLSPRSRCSCRARAELLPESLPPSPPCLGPSAACWERTSHVALGPLACAFLLCSQDTAQLQPPPHAVKTAQNKKLCKLVLLIT